MAAKVQIGAEFDGKDAVKGLNDVDTALLQLIESEKKLANQAAAKAKFDAMTEAEKEAFASAIKLADAQGKLQAELAQTADAAEKASLKYKLSNLSLTDMKSGLEMASSAIRPYIDAMKQSVDAASDLNETVSKSQVVFGDMAGAVEEMGNTAATSMGMSKNAAIGAAATYGNLFTSMGMASDKSAEMSMNLVQLASDMASFNNIPMAEALDKIRAGLVGESEPLKSLGININEAALKAEALALGLDVSSGSLDAASKAQAAYSLMLKQSANAQGDFARTADGAANQTKIMEAQVADLTASIGKGLLPAYKELLKVGNDLLAWADQMVNWGPKIEQGLIKIAVATGKTWKSTEEYNNALKDYINTANLQIDADGRVYKTIAYGSGIRKEYITDLDKMKSAAFGAVPGFMELTSGVRNVNNAMQQSAIYTDADTKAYAALRYALSNTTLSVEDQERALADLTTASGVNRAEVGLSITALNGLIGKYSSLTEAMIFNTLAAGMDEDAARALAIQMGLISPQTIAARDALDALNSKYEGGARLTKEYADRASELAAAIAKLKDKSIAIDVYYNSHGQPISPEQAGTVNPQGPGGPGGGVVPDPTDPANKSRLPVVIPTVPTIKGPGTFYQPGSDTVININGWQGDGKSLASEIDRQLEIRRLFQ